MVALHDEGRLRECTVVPGVIEMKMAVHDDSDVVRPNADLGQAAHDRILFRHDDLEIPRSERGVGTLDVHGMKPGVEEHVSLGRPDERGPDRVE